jgi:hypothetical protein
MSQALPSQPAHARQSMMDSRPPREAASEHVVEIGRIRDR